MRASTTLMALAPLAGAMEYLYVSSYDGNLTTLSLSPSQNGNATLSKVSRIAGCGGAPSWLTLSTSSRTLYCVDESMPVGTLSLFATDSRGTLTPKAKVNTIKGGVNSVLYGGPKDESFIAIAGYGAAAIATLSLSGTTPAPLQTIPFTLGPGAPTSGHQSAPYPHQVIVDPTKKFLLVPDLGADVIRIFSVDGHSGTLTQCPSYEAPKGSGPRHATFTEAGTPVGGLYLYLANELANTVSALRVAYPAAGAGGCLSLSALAAPLSPLPKAVAGAAVAEVQVRGNNLYVSNRFDAGFGPKQDSIAHIELNPKTGEFVGGRLAPAGGSTPRSFSINKKGDFLAVGDQQSGVVVVYARSISDGKLGPEVGRVDGLGGVTSIVWEES